MPGDRWYISSFVVESIGTRQFDVCNLGEKEKSGKNRTVFPRDFDDPEDRDV